MLELEEEVSRSHMSEAQKARRITVYHRLIPVTDVGWLIKNHISVNRRVGVSHRIISVTDVGWLTRNHVGVNSPTTVMWMAEHFSRVVHKLN